MINPNAIKDGSITKEKLSPNINLDANIDWLTKREVIFDEQFNINYQQTGSVDLNFDDSDDNVFYVIRTYDEEKRYCKSFIILRDYEIELPFAGTGTIEYERYGGMFVLHYYFEFESIEKLGIEISKIYPIDEIYISNSILKVAPQGLDGIAKQMVQENIGIPANLIKYLRKPFVVQSEKIIPEDLRKLVVDDNDEFTDLVRLLFVYKSEGVIYPVSSYTNTTVYFDTHNGQRAFDLNNGNKLV